MTARSKNTETMQQDRSRVIVRTGIIGIIANIILVAFKAFVGIAANSSAVISDAANNLSDALSSLITIIGTKLAGKAPNKKHPMGYGRIEYMSAFIVSAVVLYAGVTAFIDSVKKIITPGEVDYSIVSLIIIGGAVVVKIALGIYTKSKGKAVNSGSLIASGEDALSDAILSASVLVAAVIYLLFKFNIEAWVGAVIALFIIKSGIEMISDAVNEILGTRADDDLARGIKATILNIPGVHGAYDLFITNYGPDNNVASVHIEVEDTLNASEIDAISRQISTAVYAEHAVIISAVGIYSINTTNDEAVLMRENIRKRVMSREGVLQFHGFYADPDARTATFDIILDFSVDRNKLYEEITSEITAQYPDWSIHITLDTDLSE